MSSRPGEALTNLRDRLRDVEADERSEVTNAVPAVTVVNLPLVALGGIPQAGRMRFTTDGRKLGEGPGAGTGVIVYDDGGGRWRRLSDDTAVLT